VSQDLPPTYDSDIADDGSDPGEIPTFDQLDEKAQDKAREALGESFADSISEVADAAESLLRLWAMADGEMYGASAAMRRQAKQCDPEPLRRLLAMWDTIKLEACEEAD
jgi:hypothetical protein